MVGINGREIPYCLISAGASTDADLADSMSLLLAHTIVSRVI